MTHQTMRKFGYPHSVIGEMRHWAALLRPQQVTAGCAVLVCKEDVTSLGAISADAGAELPLMSRRLEQALIQAWRPEKFNYLALMMVDPQVHFHVIPRYSRPIQVAGTTIEDPGWPRLPDLAAVKELSDDQMAALLTALQAGWPIE